MGGLTCGAAATFFVRKRGPLRSDQDHHDAARLDGLADDLREGRAPGTKGIDAAADYIAGVFRELGLKPAPGAEGYFQPFTIRGNAVLVNDGELAFKTESGRIEAKAKTEFTPLSLGASAGIDVLSSKLI